MTFYILIYSRAVDRLEELSPGFNFIYGKKWLRSPIEPIKIPIEISLILSKFKFMFNYILYRDFNAK